VPPVELKSRLAAVKDITRVDKAYLVEVVDWLGVSGVWEDGVRTIGDGVGAFLSRSKTHGG